MSLALYRKYRPSSFAEVIGQDHVTEPLSNALRAGRTHHAYLFSGPRGCGKTSSARILARSLNCESGPTPEPCGECQSCRDLAANGPGSIDVIELDAATHGLVDDARDLREKVYFAPVQGRYKIYIIDEAHQLGPGAANALLKVVEEPPAHVVFIFATTEPDKLISTIRSRTHHYPFRLVPPGILAASLAAICEAENVKVAKGVLPLVVRASGGSVRDAQSVLGQLLAGAGDDGVTYEIAIALLGYTDTALLDDTIDALAAHDAGTVFQVIDRLIEAGHEPRRFAQDLLERLRDLIVLDSAPDAAHSILRDLPEDQIERMRGEASRFGSASLSRSADIVSEGLTQMRGATAPRLLLELICARVLLPGIDDSQRGMLARLERVERRGGIEPQSPQEAEPATPAPARTSVSARAKKPAANESEAAKRPAPGKSGPAPTGPVDLLAVRRLWPEIVENVKNRRRLTWSLISANAQVAAIDEKTLTLSLVNSGARDSFTRSGSDDILREAIIDVVGIDRRVEAIIDPSATTGVAAVDRKPVKGGEGPMPVVEEVEERADDKNIDEVSVADLLARELGAKVIGE
ncbi:MAG TPA: DNA polymerase III subunit gamma and tau [Candidatus Nanopelagicaceae bacterium]|nr:DNA polymerase III subunit gamma and tau [Candidatus Nanopelagicaceae bacterium]